MKHYIRCYAIAALALASGVSAFAPVQLKTNLNSVESYSQAALNTVIEAPVRKPETPERVKEVRNIFLSASRNAADAKGCASADFLKL